MHEDESKPPVLGRGSGTFPFLAATSSRSADPVKRCLRRSTRPCDAQWEWWYFNGHLETATGRRFDYFWSSSVIMD